MKERQSRRMLAVGALVLTGSLTAFALYAKLRAPDPCFDCGGWGENPLKARLQAAKTLLRVHRFVEAKVVFTKVQTADYFHEAPSVGRYLEVVEHEISNEQALYEARSAVASGRVTEASATLQQVTGTQMLTAEGSALKAAIAWAEGAPDGSTS